MNAFGINTALANTLNSYEPNVITNIEQLNLITPQSSCNVTPTELEVRLRKVDSNYIVVLRSVYFLLSRKMMKW